MNPSRLQQLLERASKCHLLVIGDVMLDEFVWGKVSRISPEAPVPVVEVQSESSYPGGAANVARNLRPFCSAVSLCGMVGTDATAARLSSLLQEEGIATNALVQSQTIPTIVKTRIIARQQQVVRVDREKKDCPGAEVIASALERVRGLLPKVDGIIFEDYGKGFLSQAFVDDLCALGRQAGKIITADPNPHNPIRWNHVNVLKPNRAEAFTMAGTPDPGAAEDPLADEALKKVGSRTLELLGIPALLVTLGEHGIALFEKNEPLYHTPTRAREVFDVSGAGDTTIALFTLALCAGASLREAAEISNHAAGVVVGKLGTATLTPAELIASFEDHGG